MSNRPLALHSHADTPPCAILPQVLSDVLDSCGNNIDAAIKRLGELQLTAQCSAAAHPSVAQLRGEEAGQAHSGTGQEGCAGLPC